MNSPRRPQMRHVHVNQGFTLIELLVALLVFTATSALGYQMLSTSLNVQSRVLGSIEQQNQRRTAYRELRNALSAQGDVRVEESVVEINLSSAVTPWSLGKKSVRFEIVSDELWQFDGQAKGGIKLLDGFAELRFVAVYAKDQVARSPNNTGQTQALSQPVAIRLSWGPATNFEVSGGVSLADSVLSEQSTEYWLFKLQ